MDILKQKICLVILHFILEITLLNCNSTSTGGPSSTKMLNVSQHRRQGFDLQTPARAFQTRAARQTRRRSTPYRETYDDECAYILHYCHKTYQTGRLCGRTLFFHYYTFRSFCMLDYANCKEKYEVWQVAHMGQCYDLKTITEYIHVEYTNDSFLDTDYVVDDHRWKW
ncbi:hypothetical protein PYW08_009636 [Mythimna loreyi]|uniref:Uncharacterized protein n=1 Tax=Mythimna loreyi TaxID=667449 RepID=A0ACC2QAE7_9NEOP|nr:hypothetical protein PYW08_009636 [Mythimna loreyi]